MSDEKIETTDEHFNVFREEANKWLDVFGLKGWGVRVLHTDEGKPSGAKAWLSAKYCDRIASICMAKTWEHPIANPPTDENIRRDAFHEVCELLLEPMDVLAGSRNWDREEFDAARHAVVRILENVIWEKSNAVHAEKGEVQHGKKMHDE